MAIYNVKVNLMNSDENPIKIQSIGYLIKELSQIIHKMVTIKNKKRKIIKYRIISYTYMYTYMSMPEAK